MITPPQPQPIVFLPAFALYVAFPRSDYYAGSAPDGVRLRPSRLAQFRAGQTYRVPVFRSSTFVRLGGVLYPWRYGRRAMGACPVPNAAFGASSSGHRENPPHLFASPPRHRVMEVIWSEVRGIRRALRYLTIRTVVARRAADGPPPVQFRPICL